MDNCGAAPVVASAGLAMAIGAAAGGLQGAFVAKAPEVAGPVCAVHGTLAWGSRVLVRVTVADRKLTKSGFNIWAIG